MTLGEFCFWGLVCTGKVIYLHGVSGPKAARETNHAQKIKMA